MYNQVLKSLLLVISGAFSPNPRIRNLAAFAGGLLLASFASAAFTSFVSHASYAEILNVSPDHPFAWGFSIFIGWVMFVTTNTIALWIVEGFSPIEEEARTVSNHAVAVAFLVFAGLGAFDVVQNLHGAEYQASEWHQTTEFFQAIEGREKPYQSLIDANLRSIDNLFADKIGGEMRWGNQDRIDDLNAQNAVLIARQNAALDSMQSANTASNQIVLKRQSRAKGKMRYVSAFVYGLMLIFSVGYVFFAIEIDLSDGKYDGVYREHGSPQKSRSLFGFRRKEREPVIGFQRESEGERLARENEELRRKLQESENRKSVTDHGGKGANSEGIGIGKDSRFSSFNQPEKRNGGVYAERADSAESRAAILSAYRGISRTGEKPTYAKIGGITGLSTKTVGKYVRRMKREGVI